MVVFDRVAEPSNVGTGLEHAGEADPLGELIHAGAIGGGQAQGNGQIQSGGQRGEAKLACQILNQFVVRQEESVIPREDVAVPRNQHERGLVVERQHRAVRELPAQGDQIGKRLLGLGTRTGDQVAPMDIPRVQGERFRV